MKVDTSKIRQALKKNKEEEEKKKKGFVDERIWKPEIPKKDKNVYRVRVLPYNDDVPYVKLFQHQIKTTRGFWYENCPSTIDKECPICDRANELFATEDDADENEAFKLYKKKVYFANIIVVKDPRNDGENEGKVFLYRFGQKIFAKFEAALFPNVDEGEEELFFICPKEGYDFNVITKTLAGFANYDESKFVQKSTPIAKNAKKADAIIESTFDVSEEINPKKFKSFDELQDMFEKKVLGGKGSSKPSKSVDDDDDWGNDDASKKSTSNDDEWDDDDDSSSSSEPTAASDDDDDLLEDLDDFED